jgi:hypothetical protein
MRWRLLTQNNFMMKTIIRIIVEKYQDGTAALFAQQPTLISELIEDELDFRVAEEAALELSRENGISNPTFAYMAAGEPFHKTVLVGPWFNFEHAI